MNTDELDGALVGLDQCSLITVTRHEDGGIAYEWNDPTTPYCAIGSDFEPCITQLPWKLRRVAELGSCLVSNDVAIYKREGGVVKEKVNEQ